MLLYVSNSMQVWTQLLDQQKIAQYVNFKSVIV